MHQGTMGAWALLALVACGGSPSEPTEVQPEYAGCPGHGLPVGATATAPGVAGCWCQRYVFNCEDCSLVGVYDVGAAVSSQVQAAPLDASTCCFQWVTAKPGTVTPCW